MGGGRLDLPGAYDQLGIPDGMPFLLNDDGTYDLRLNQFLSELPTMGVYAEKVGSPTPAIS